MITDDFSFEEGVVTRERMLSKPKHKEADDCVITFRPDLFWKIIKSYKSRKLGTVRTCSQETDYYKVRLRNKSIILYLSPITSALAGGTLEEVSYKTGISRVYVFGSCGVLGKDLINTGFILPEFVYRDEGFSYHYCPPSDYIEVPCAKTMAKYLRKCHLPYFIGNFWTTDAMYRETPTKISNRRVEGCLGVDMEVAGLQALCTFYGYEFYPVLFGSDIVSEQGWQNIHLGKDTQYQWQRNCWHVIRDFIDNER